MEILMKNQEIMPFLKGRTLFLQIYSAITSVNCSQSSLNEADLMGLQMF